MEFPTSDSDSNQREGARDLCTLIDAASVQPSSITSVSNLATVFRKLLQSPIYLFISLHQCVVFVRS
jgi:hypothetical protein